MKRKLPSLTSASLFCLILLLVSVWGFMINGEDPGYEQDLVNISSDITDNTTWTPGNEPYIVDGMIEVSSGVILTIIAGTDIRFTSDSGLIVKGSLHADGEGSPITFQADGTSSKGAWRGLTAQNATGIYLMNSIIRDANVSLFLNGTTNSTVRDSSIDNCIYQFKLDNDSTTVVENSTVNGSLAKFMDNVSMIETYQLYTCRILDYKFDPAGGIRIEIYNNSGVRKTSYWTNSTGLMTEQMLRGQDLTENGWTGVDGTYNLSLVNGNFTHYVNSSFTHNGSDRGYDEFRFSWPPELSWYKSNVSTTEDTVSYIGTNVLDRNGVGTVNVLSSSDNVVYNWTLSKISILYEDESTPFEIVYINLTDGYDETSYRFDITVIPVDDPVSIELPTNVITIREETAYPLPVFLEDEDTPIGSINVYSDDPDNISYDPGNTSLTFLYPDGTPERFTVNITAEDGNSSQTIELIVNFKEVNFAPDFILPLPDIVIDEDNITNLDLGPYITDPDGGDQLHLNIKSEDFDLFSARVDGTVITIHPMSDSNGEGKALLTVTDSSEYTSKAYLNVTILPVNDEPYLYLGHYEVDSPGTYRFVINYTDIDGDPAETIELVLDGVGLQMHPSSLLDGNPRSGIRYAVEVDIEPGDHTYYYRCSDGSINYSTPETNLNVPLVEDGTEITMFESSLTLRIWYLGKGDRPQAVFIDEIPEPPDDYLDIGCSFRIDHGNVTITRVEVEVYLIYFREDIKGSLTDIWYNDDGNWSEAGYGYFDRNSGLYHVEVSGEGLNHTLSIFSILDPDFDSDRDSYSNLVDRFPQDPNEWNDTDNDGIGDNSDPDDDNDGYNDTIEVTAGSDPLNDESLPLDTDGDELLDIFDFDDDGDGMTDAWEIENGLNPLDGSDAILDNDGDGKSNIDEFRDGTDPFRSDSENGIDYLMILLAVIGILSLIILLVIGLFMIIRTGRKDDEEVEEEEREREWEIQGEIDPEEAMICSSCREVFPNNFDRCPFCENEEIEPYSEFDEDDLDDIEF